MIGVDEAVVRVNSTESSTAVFSNGGKAEETAGGGEAEDENTTGVP
jgi:hypothetical protein